jgi:hypothetical protein
MERAERYREQAAYCAYLLSRALGPTRRRLLERERNDWLMVAEGRDRLQPLTRHSTDERSEFIRSRRASGSQHPGPNAQMPPRGSATMPKSG